MDIFGNYISKCNRFSENIRYIKAIEVFIGWERSKNVTENPCRNPSMWIFPSLGLDPAQFNLLAIFSFSLIYNVPILTQSTISKLSNLRGLTRIKDNHQWKTTINGEPALMEGWTFDGRNCYFLLVSSYRWPSSETNNCQ